MLAIGASTCICAATSEQCSNKMCPTQDTALVQTKTRTSLTSNHALNSSEDLRQQQFGTKARSKGNRSMDLRSFQPGPGNADSASVVYCRRRGGMYVSKVEPFMDQKVQGIEGDWYSACQKCAEYLEKTAGFCLLRLQCHVVAGLGVWLKRDTKYNADLGKNYGDCDTFMTPSRVLGKLNMRVYGSKQYYAYEYSCVSSHNIKTYTGRSVSECGEICNRDRNCLAFEYGRSSSSCRPQSASDRDGCDGRRHNLDLYVKAKKDC